MLHTLVHSPGAWCHDLGAGIGSDWLRYFTVPDLPHQYLHDPKGPFHARGASLPTISYFNALRPSRAPGTCSVTVGSTYDSPCHPCPVLLGPCCPIPGHLEHTLPSIPVLLVPVLAQDSSSLISHLPLYGCLRPPESHLYRPTAT